VPVHDVRPAVWPITASTLKPRPRRRVQLIEIKALFSLVSHVSWLMHIDPLVQAKSEYLVLVERPFTVNLSSFCDMQFLCSRDYNIPVCPVLAVG
jgi:hypothetical protein